MSTFVKRYLEKLKKRASVSDICPPPLLPLTNANIQPGTENERIGLVRNSMFQNPLILKPELGRTRRRCAKIPGASFAYGLTAHGTEGGVPEAIGHWQVIPPCVIKKKEIPKDFIHMNSNGIKAGLFTAKEHCLYRQHHELHCKPTVIGKIFHQDVSHLHDGMTYGKPYPPATPITEILQHKFSEQWLQEQRKANMHLKQKKHLKKREKGYETRLTMLNKYQIPVKIDSQWHMPKFQKIAPHLDTFPSQEDRLNAMKVQQREASVRRGQFGWGIYTHI
ncbi:cilia- and flagella-associated protein 77-like [Erythrolamprus reginae]|uniref:cilia- and flagella-associated protein 77-like n=1 Tax=Erythrolamprus reginae TaxID=121349 RepID=UPI00396C8E96